MPDKSIVDSVDGGEKGLEQRMRHDLARQLKNAPDHGIATSWQMKKILNRCFCVRSCLNKTKIALS